MPILHEKASSKAQIFTFAPYFQRQFFTIAPISLFQHLKVESAGIHVTDVHTPAVNLNAAGFRAGQVMTHEVVVEVKNIETLVCVYDSAAHPRRG